MVNIFQLLKGSDICWILKARAFWLFLFLTFVCGSPAIAQNSQKVRKMKAERSELKKQIQQSEDLLKSTKKDVTSQLSNLAILDAQIIEKQNYINRLKLDADSLVKAIRFVEKQLDTLSVELTGCKANYRKAMTFVARNKVKQSRWMFVFMAHDFRDLYRRMRYAAQYSKYQRVQGQVIQEKELVIRKKKKHLVEVKREKENLMLEGRKEQTDLEKKKADRKVMVEKLNEKQRSIQTIINRDRKKFKEIDRRIEQLIKEEIAAAERRRQDAERKRKAAEERRVKEKAARKAASQKKAPTAIPKKAASSSALAHAVPAPKLAEAEDIDRQLSSDFVANRGRLPMPITGAYAVTSRYGTYDVDGLRGVRLENKGINITGRRGAQARSIFTGEIVTVANFGGSYTIIIRHGDYYSVYNNLSTVSVHRGQKVKTGQTLGTLVVDKSGNSLIHFQLRHKTKTLNPQVWIK